MHLSNVSDFAPPGYQLARTEYDGCTRHVFARLDDPSREIALECRPANAAEETDYLEAFRDMHTPKPEAKPVLPEPASEVAVAATSKPSRRRA